MKRLLALLLVIVCAGTALAGYRTSVPVTVDVYSRRASGTIADARASTDSTQFIGCAVYGYSTVAQGVCEAQNSKGVNVYCYTTDAPMITAISSVRDGYLTFTWDANGKCTYVYTSNNSAYAPKG
jgi:hypothetical protein